MARKRHTKKKHSRSFNPIIIRGEKIIYHPILSKKGQRYLM